MKRELTAALCIFCLLACPAFAAEDREDESGMTFDFDMRGGVGGSYKMTGGMAEWGVGVDLLALLRFTFGEAGQSIMPEFGYSASIHAEGDGVVDHYFVGGVGYGYYSDKFAAGIVPSLVVGRTQGFHHGIDDGYGYRTTLFIEAPRWFGLQVHHQIVLFGGEMVNEFCISGSLNLEIVVIPLLFLR
ncbi:MAG: hypothetical protein JXR96_17280 [Deltaproteobacteria bacterium]|nr:hypothetical protein [Deltaproteobacteria bacterium]